MGKIPPLHVEVDRRRDREIGEWVASIDLKDDKGRTWGTVALRDYSFEHAERLARLWAAAPELLAALKLVESVYRKNCIAAGEPSSVLDAMQAPIAKAEAP